MSARLFDPKIIIPMFDKYLDARGLSFSAIVIGGAALAVLGIIDRHTIDVDLLESGIPAEILSAAVEFASLHSISEQWLNNGPASTVRDLPAGWRDNIQPLYSGRALRLWTLDRQNLIGTKLWAMCDRMRDLSDLIDLAPSDQEIVVAAAWVKQLDGNPLWPAHVDTNVKELRRRLGRE